MRRAVLMMTAAALVLGTAVAHAQTPNLSGTWTMVVDPNAAAGRGGRGGLGPTVTINQNATTLTTTRTGQNGEIKMVYNLDGSDSKNTVAGRGGSTEQVAHAKWDGSKLTISTTVNMGGSPVVTSMSLSMDGSGNLVVASTRPGQDGTPMTTTSTYKKGS